VDYSGTVGSFYLNLARGDTANGNFDGWQVFPKYCQFNYSVQGAATAQGDWSTIRIIIGQTNEPTLPTPADILTQIGNANAPYGLRRLQKQKNIKVLYDRTHTMNAFTDFAQNYKVFIKGNRLRSTEFTTSGALSVTKGDIFWMAISDDGITVYPGFTYCGRIMFAD